MFIDEATALNHMLDAAQEAVSFAYKRNRNELDYDRMLTLALLKSLEILGEAASRITTHRQYAFTQIPWQKILHMRNTFIDAYFEIDLDEVWRTVNTDLPLIIIELEKIIAENYPK
ncbi:MAG: HepT-like ribonuclease domain-containing protein [Oscillatoria sp. PMC 1068.18]|nr:HepT-like ribonuclease domain-containing protein [Oscillatoria sp. PMC 1076.18]MEC4987959.1 HepT-like ribonuclease domain-containing protein [Oscillatoria sp. PMC 1068.18]